MQNASPQGWVYGVSRPPLTDTLTVDNTATPAYRKRTE